MADARYNNGLTLLKQGIESFAHYSKPVQNLHSYRNNMIEQIEQQAEILLNEPIPELDRETYDLFKTTGSRNEYEQLYFVRRKRLTAFGLMVIVKPHEQRYREGLQAIIQAVCNEYTWCLPAHYDNERSIDLFAAETAFTLAELNALLGERLPHSLRETMKKEISKRVLEPFLAVESIWWERADHNWASVCAGSIGAAALYEMKNDDRLELVLQRAEQAMLSYLSGFDEDGACKEGYSYWQYGFGYFIYFADLLRAYRDGQSNLLASHKVKRIALFQQKCFLAGKYVVNFSDSLPQVGVYMGLTHYLHAEYAAVHIPEQESAANYEEDHCGRWAPAVRNLLWTTEACEGKPWPEQSYCMEQAQWLVSRAKLKESSIAFAAKGGHNDEPHNHNDLGHFILAVDGHSLLVDAGSGQYTRDYFGEKRYDYVCASAAGHSVPIIDGLLQLPGRQYASTLLDYSTSKAVDRMVLDLKSAYPSERLLAFTRSFTWEKPFGKLVLHDKLESNEQACTITERFIVANAPESLDEGRVKISNGFASVVISYDPAQLIWETEAYQYVDHFGQPRTLHRLDFHVAKPQLKESIVFTFELEPNG